MDKLLEIITRWANDPYICHEEYSKCGLCLKEKLRSDVCKEFLKSNPQSANSNDLIRIEQTITNLFQQSELYQKVQSKLSQGLSLDAALKEVEKEGFIP